MKKRIAVHVEELDLADIARAIKIAGKSKSQSAFFAASAIEKANHIISASKRREEALK